MEQRNTSDQSASTGSTNPDGSKRRQAYQRPSLTEYGSVAKLTQGTLTTQSDGKTGGFKMGCL